MVGDQSEPTARSGEAKEKLGEEGFPDDGRQMCCLVSRSTRLEFSSARNPPSGRRVYQQVKLWRKMREKG